MRSNLAATHRDALRRVERSLSPLERLHLAQRLGDEAAAQFASAHGVTARESAQEFARRRQLGRRRSRCAAGA